MAHRSRVRGTTIAAAALVLSTPALSACGFNAATDRVYTPGAGANHREASVDVLNAVIVAAEDGSGQLVATMSNNSATEPALLSAAQGSGQPTAQVETGSLEVPPRAAVNLAEDGGLPATGDFELGDFVPMTFRFSTAEGTESIEIKVPVVPDGAEFAGLSGAEPSATSESEPSEDESHSDSDSH